MKRLILILLLILLPVWAGQVWAAAAACSTAGGGSGICYVDAASAGGNGTTTGLSGANAAFATSTALNALTYAAGDQILFKRGATYGLVTVPTSGSSGTPITYSSYGSGDAVITAGVDAVAIDTNGKNYLTFSGLTIIGEFKMNGVTGIIINRCIIRDSGAVPGGAAVYANNVGTWGIYNSIVVNNSTAGIMQQTGSPTGTVMNNIIVANARGTAKYGINVTTATLNYDYNIVFANNALPFSTNISGGTDGGHNIVISDPLFISGYGDAINYFTVGVDDSASLAYAVSLAAALNPLGVYITFATGYDPTHVGDLQALASAGNEISVHTWDHIALDATAIYTVSSTNSGTNTVTVDIAANNQIILVSSGTPANNVTISTNSNQTIADLKTAVAGKGWTITNNAAANDANRLLIAADSGGAQTCPYVVVPDTTATNRFYKGEIKDEFDWLVSIGITPTTLTWPTGNYSANAAAYARDTVGLVAGRSVGAVGFGYPLESFKLWNAHCLAASTSKGAGTQAAIISEAQWYFASAAYGNSYACIHDYTTTAFSIQQWTWYVNEILRLGGKFKTFGQVASAIIADHSTADSLTYTKTYTNTSNYSLQSSSPAKDAGVDVGLTTDYDGHPVPHGSKPDIGAYEYGAFATLGSGGTGSLGGSGTMTLE
jgi:hypothetical protein